MLLLGRLSRLGTNTGASASCGTGTCISTGFCSARSGIGVTSVLFYNKPSPGCLLLLIRGWYCTITSTSTGISVGLLLLVMLEVASIV